MASRSKLIAIAYDMNFKHAAEIFSGASDYVLEKGLDWQLLPLNFGFEAKLMELAESTQLDGAIGTFVSDEWVRGLTSLNVTAVNLFNFSEIKSIPSICLDDRAIGRAAARHLVEQGAKSFAFIGQNEVFFNKLRRESFMENCPKDLFHDVPSQLSRRLQSESLKDLKQPIGVLCSSDRIAREICTESKLLGMKPGKNILVVGVGNDPTESTFAGIGLSSFEVPSRLIGYQAAKKMADCMSRKSQTPEPSLSERLETKLLLRESSLPSPRSRLAERALALMTESLTDADFDIASLAERLGASRRALELTTREQFNKSPYQILSEQRLNKAKDLLLKTNMPVGRIGEDCGYPEPHHFSAWFKQKTRHSPREWRSVNRFRDSSIPATQKTFQGPQTERT